MADHIRLEGLEGERLRTIVLSCLKPKHKVYVHSRKILIHKEDIGDGWGLVKLSMIMSNEETKDWEIETYEKPNEFKWKVILWGTKK